MRSFQKNLAVAFVAVMALLGGMVSSSHAVSYLVTDIGVDTFNPANTGKIHFDASGVQKLLTSTTTGIDLTFTDPNTNTIVGPVHYSNVKFTYSTTLFSSSPGNGDFSGGTFSLDDLNTNTNLLSGTVNSYNLFGKPGGTQATVNGLFSPNAGLFFLGGSFDGKTIAPSFQGGGIIIGSSASITPGLDFTQSFDGTEKTDVQPTQATPEPGSLLLLGSGLVALGLAARRKKNS